MRIHSRELEKFCEGYEEDQLISEGYIAALYKNKLINNCERKWLSKIYVDDIQTDDGLASRYKINKRGQVEDYNEDELED